MGIALWDFHADGAYQISLRRGDILRIIEAYDENSIQDPFHEDGNDTTTWFRGFVVYNCLSKICQNEFVVGIFPSSVIQQASNEGKQTSFLEENQLSHLS